MGRKPKNPSLEGDSEQLGLNLGDSIEPVAAQKSTLKKSKRSDSKQKLGRIERVLIRDRMEKSISTKRGDGSCIRNCSIEVSKTAFGLTPKDLYALVGGLPGDRDTLPVDIQEKLMIHELMIVPKLDAQDIRGETQIEINREILWVVRRQSQATERFLREHNIHQELVSRYRIAQALGSTETAPPDLD